ncbi:MAG: phosphoglycerate kinase [Deltaproteobacteria bacterium]|nr:phosphoglycerate kinase [Candidatus Zymogenaceae bacterium]
MEQKLSPDLPLLQNADLKGRVVLVRVDHNVVKKGDIADPFRIEATIGTLSHIIEQGGLPVLMTHVGRPRDKKTGNITVSDATSVAPIVEYLKTKLNISFLVPECPATEEGIVDPGNTLKDAVERLKRGDVGGVYLPNTRWFAGEETKGEERARFAAHLASLADVYVNDAFGSWQPHASTFDVARLLPSYAGFLMQKELIGLNAVLNPKRPFVAVVAGAKYDTKIGPVRALFDRADTLILGGVIYNTYLAARYNTGIEGVSDDEKALAREVISLDEKMGKILEPRAVTESDVVDERVEGKYRTVDLDDIHGGGTYHYFLDVAPAAFEDPGLKEAIGGAKTIFVNAVMGFAPHFIDGSRALYDLIDKNRDAMKLFGGGDTLATFKKVLPDAYRNGIEDDTYYFFTGGGAVLKVIEEGDPYALEPVRALMESGK